MTKTQIAGAARTIGIVAHSAEGAALCFITVCREGQNLMGAHMYPEIVVSAIPMGLSMGAWESEDYDAVAALLRRGVEVVARAGADFFVCSDNTAHIALERVADTLPIPGLHIADVVCSEIKARGFSNAGLLGTRWTMTGPVYAAALERHGIGRVVPNAERREELNRAIFDELCQAQFLPSTTDMFVDVIGELKAEGADCAILGCTEIPLIITDDNSPLPTMDSTRLLAKHAVRLALSDTPLQSDRGWLVTQSLRSLMTTSPDDLPLVPAANRTEAEAALIASVLSNTLPLHCDVIGPGNLMEVSRGVTFEEPVGGHRLDLTVMLTNLSAIATVIQFSAFAAGWAIAKARKSSGTAAQPSDVLSTAVRQQFSNDPRIAAVLRDDPAVIDKIVTDVLARLTTSQNSSQAT